MRLIDANKIGLTDFEILMCNGNYKEGLEMILQKIEDAPTIDAVPVVRCMECRWWDKIEGSPLGYCHACKHAHFSTNWEISIYRTYKEDFYCADGERKDGDKDG